MHGELEPAAPYTALCGDSRENPVRAQVTPCTAPSGSSRAAMGAEQEGRCQEGAAPGPLSLWGGQPPAHLLLLGWDWGWHSSSPSFL